MLSCAVKLSEVCQARLACVDCMRIFPFHLRVYTLLYRIDIDADSGLAFQFYTISSP